MFAIKITPNYYPGTVNPPEHHMTVAESEDDPTASQEVAEFPTEGEAEEVIDQIMEDDYFLADGEAGRPDYEVVSL